MNTERKAGGIDTVCGIIDDVVHLCSYGELKGECLPLGIEICRSGESWIVCKRILLTLVKSKFYHALVCRLCFKAEGNSFTDIRAICPDLFKDGKLNVIVLLYSACNCTGINLEAFVIIRSNLIIGINAISGSCNCRSSTNAVKGINKGFNRKCSFCNAGCSTEGVRYTGLERLTVL